MTTNYTLDLNTGLTQVLNDGTSAYVYGNGRIAQAGMTTEYFLGDALGSVRQLTDASGEITYSRVYDPYGVVTSTIGSSHSVFGYTGAYFGDSTQLTYLRSRFYAGSTGRFLTRDTWSGDYSSPISYNKWIYAYQNPINLLDPTGMKPGDSKYCFPLSGRDSQYCNNIVRGINPDQPMTAGDYIVFDQLDSCYTPPLHEVLPHSAPTYTQFGLWYHYLLERTPGWWNNQGRDHIYFRDVIAFALGVELSSKGSDRNLVGYAAGAFATKAWAPDQGFYKFIGSRQSVFMRVNHALYGTNSGLDENGKGLPYNFAQFQGSFNPAKDEADYHIQARYGGPGNWGDHILTHSGFTNPDQLLAWEWGNPTLSSPQKFLNKLRSFDNMGRDRTQVLWFSDQWYKNYPRKNIDGTIVYNLAFVVTQDQMYESCGIYSCVVP